MTIESPCAKCPWLAKFKGGDDYLQPGRRRGIMVDLLSGATGSFPCHETVDHDDDACNDDDSGCVTGGIQCAGASLVLLRAGRDTQMIRIEENLGMLDTAALLERNERVELWTLRECLDELDEDEDEETDTCNVVNAGCEAPAGYLIGGEAVRGTDTVDTRCPACGEFVCDNCSDDDGRCLNGECSEEEPDDDYDY